MTENNLQPILVKCPYSGNIINVEPLFKHLQTMNAEETDKEIDKSIRLLALYTDETPENDLKFAFCSLYMLRELFSNLAQCNISPSKK